jgi:hypothetical protein
MNTLLVWILINGYSLSGGSIQVGPPYSDLESCQRIQQAIVATYPDTNWRLKHLQCVQVRIPNVPNQSR